jgi:phosphoribosylformimino-5-aminoimidazole carboxamide ribotide isomerase
MRTQIGGGIRTMEAVARWMDAGAARVILGTAAVRDPGFVKQAAREFPGGVVVGIDARGGKVAVSGWAEQTDIDALDLARQFEDAGVAALIVTDIARDGLKDGVNVDFTGAMADAVSIPVIASGGVRDVGDIRALRARAGTPIYGAILGRALYDGDIDPATALSAAA